MIFKFYITSVVLCVYIFIHKAKTDDLQFWKRDPKFDNRRVERSKHSATTIKEVTEQKFSYTREPVRYVPNEHVTLAEPHLRVQDDTSTPDDSRRGKFYGRQTVSYPKIKRIRGKQKGRQGESADQAQVMSTRIIPDVQPEINNQKWWFTDVNRTGDIYNLSPYSIARQLEQITSKLPEANVSMEILGRTAEYNDIVLIKVTEKKSEIDKYFRADDSKYIDEVPEKKIIFIVHGLSVMGLDQMSVFKLSHLNSKLFSYYFAHLDKFDIFLIPMANPDGYAYVMNHMGSAYWNKNLTPQNGCAGVALDRNFDVAWNISTPISTCSQHYPGSSPFSEPESKAVRNVMHRYSHKIIAYMHLHSGTYDSLSFKGDAVLYPRGYSDAQSDDDKYIDLKGEIDESMKNASFKYLSVAVDTLYNWYGKVYGTSVDYASTVYGIPYAMELVMQMYNNGNDYEVIDVDYQNIALEQIWARVIDVIFKSIWKNMHSNDVQ